MQVEKLFYYIPILKTLQEQLKSKAILQMVFSQAENITNSEIDFESYLVDFNDGLFV